MEVLSRILRNIEEGNLIRGFHARAMNYSVCKFLICCLLMTLSYFVMFLGNNCCPWLALSCFQAFIGLKVNVGKSEIVPIDEMRNLDILANILHCRVANFPMKYLGMPLGTLFKTSLIWNPILKKIEKKLSRWKRLYLSKGGRLTLLKNTLSSLPTYFLSLFTIPKTVAARLENIQKNIL